jgi:hypothetical protein
LIASFHVRLDDSRARLSAASNGVMLETVALRHEIQPSLLEHIVVIVGERAERRLRFRVCAASRSGAGQRIVNGEQGRVEELRIDAGGSIVLVGVWRGTEATGSA